MFVAAWNMCTMGLVLSMPDQSHCNSHSLGCLQERAYVTGLRAANLVIGRLGKGQPAPILDTEADEPHLAFGKAAARTLRGLAERVQLPQPFL